jgi:hypothetical protein
MAIDQFDLPISPAEGLGFHEHRLDGGGLVSRYHRHRPAVCEGSWTLGTAWSCTRRGSQTPSECDGHRWCEAAFQPAIPEWRESTPAARCVLQGRAGDTLYLRQSFDADSETAALALEILIERALELYLNGELICKLEALAERPPAWKSAGGSRTINSPLLHLPLNQRLVRRGRNSLALRVADRSRAGWEGKEYIAFRSLIETVESGHE